MKKSDEIFLNVASVIVGSYTNGPGKRLVIWVQGCTIKCKGCCNEELQPHIAKHLVDPELFAIKIVELCKKHQCEGVTISGGEPFQQSIALNKFLSAVKDNNLTITCFSGYESIALLNSKELIVRSLIKKLDLLIAGQFNIANACHNRTWYENPDKNVVFLTSAYSPSDSLNNENLEYLIKDDYVDITGFPNSVDNWKYLIQC